MTFLCRCFKKEQRRERLELEDILTVFSQSYSFSQFALSRYSAAGHVARGRVLRANLNFLSYVRYVEQHIRYFNM